MVLVYRRATDETFTPDCSHVSETSKPAEKPGAPSPEDVDDDAVCVLCFRPDREDMMLMCDKCNDGHHIDCLNPPLTAIPEGPWLCADCTET